MSKISEIVDIQNKIDSYLLDDDNAILVKMDKDNKLYMIHERLVNKRLDIINKWSIPYYSENQKNIILEDYNLFIVKTSDDFYDYIYNYKKGSFVTPNNLWNKINICKDEKDNLMYEGFATSIDLNENNMDLFKNNYSVDNNVNYGRYYSILNIDGTIKDDCLYQYDKKIILKKNI